MKFLNASIGFMAFSAYFRIGTQLAVFLSLARFLGTEQFGQFSYWLSVATLISIPINYGFGNQLLREAGRSPEKLQTIFTSMFFTKTTLTITTIILSVVFWLFTQESNLFIIILLAAITESYVDLYNFLLRSRGFYQQEARLTVITSIVQLSLVACTAFISTNAALVAVAYLCSRIIAIFLTRRAIYKSFPTRKLRADFSFATVRDAMYSGFPYAADIGVTTFNSTIDVILLKQMSDLHSVGIYQAGMRLMLGATTPATVAVNVYLPRISSLDSKSAGYSQAIINLNMKMVVVGGIFSLILAIFSKMITTVLFGAEYQTLSMLLPLFALLLVLRYVAAALGINLTASGHQSVRVIANLIYSVVFISASLILIPLYKTSGLLMASIFSVLVLIIVYYIYVAAIKLPFGFNAFNSLIFISITAVIVYLLLIA